MAEAIVVGKAQWQELEVAGQVALAVRKQRAARRWSMASKSQGPPSKDPLPLARLHLKIHYYLSKQSHPPGDQMFRQISLRETFHILFSVAPRALIGSWPSHNGKSVQCHFKSLHSLNSSNTFKSLMPL